MSNNTELALRLSINEVIKIYEEATQEIQKAFAKINEAEIKINEAFLLEPSHYNYLDIVPPPSRKIKWKDPKDTMEFLEQRAWKVLVERLDIRRIMSVKAWRNLEKQLKNGDMPELNIHNVTTVTQGFYNQLPDMFEEAVLEVFDFLRPRNRRYKTNEKFEIGKKVILTQMVRLTWSGCFEPFLESEAELTALENVFSALDGQGQITKTHFSELSNAIKASKGYGETKYFRFKCFLNNNIHLEFIRPDLLQKLNQIAGGLCLKDGK